MEAPYKEGGVCVGGGGMKVCSNRPVQCSHNKDGCITLDPYMVNTLYISSPDDLGP